MKAAPKASAAARLRLLGGFALRDVDASALHTCKAELLSRVEESTAEVIWIHLTTIFNAAGDDKRLLKNPCKVHPTLALRAREHFRRVPSVECTLPWRNPETPTTALEARQRKPIAVRLVLSSQGNRINYRTWNERSWKPALVAADVLKAVGEKVQQYGGRTRRNPIFKLSREDTFHVLRHMYASVQLEAGESIVSLSEWLGHSSPKITLDHYAHFMPGAGKRGLAAMAAWLTQDQQQKVPEKSPATPWIRSLTVNPQVKGLIKSVEHVKVKYKETSRGGLAVNVIEC